MVVYCGVGRVNVGGGGGNVDGGGLSHACAHV